MKTFKQFLQGKSRFTEEAEGPEETIEQKWAAKVPYLEKFAEKLKQFVDVEENKTNVTDADVEKLYGQIKKWMSDAYRRCEELKNNGGNFKRFEDSYYRVYDVMGQARAYLGNPEQFQWFRDREGRQQKRTEPVTPTRMYQTYLIQNCVGTLADAIGSYLFGIQQLNRNREIEQERTRKAKEEFASAKPMKPEEQESLETFVNSNAKDEETRQLYLRAIKQFVAEKRTYDWAIYYLKSRDSLSGK